MNMDQVGKLQKLAEWTTATETLKKAKKREAKLRQEAFDLFFPDPEEGVNTAQLEAGYKLKGTHKINRNLDEAALPAVFEKLPEGTKDLLIKEKPNLILAAYKKLNKKNRNVFDMALTIKPGTPSMEIVAPKEK